jgi:mono/diheme cytochrome c family protein
MLCGGLALAGCGAPSSRFVLNERTQELQKDARTKIEATLEENFGTPGELVGWLRLPVDYGGAHGTVSEGNQPAGGGAVDSFIVKIREDAPAIQANQSLTWLSGAYAGAVQRVKRYDASSGELMVEGDMDPAPMTGDAFVVDFGSVLADGKMLFAQHCVHCHGVSGDGNGPTARYLKPRPRDYRQGKFKFTSTLSPDKARRDDLRRVVLYGIPGTYMPSFRLLKEDEVHAVVEYVRWLAMRGEFEQKLADDLSNNYSLKAIAERREGGESQADIDAELKEYLEQDYPEYLDEVATNLADAWTRAESPGSIVLPKQARTPSTLASRIHGRELFLDDKKSKCVTCHGPTGRGDGEQTEAFQENPFTRQKYPEPGLYDDWGNRIFPRDLQSGIYRGGRRPLDLYRRIYAGIKGTPMPAFGTVLSDEEIWDVVNYVMSMPYSGPWPDEVGGAKIAAARTGESSESR